MKTVAVDKSEYPTVKIGGEVVIGKGLCVLIGSRIWVKGTFEDIKAEDILKHKLYFAKVKDWEREENRYALLRVMDGA